MISYLILFLVIVILMGAAWLYSARMPPRFKVDSRDRPRLKSVHQILREREAERKKRTIYKPTSSKE